MGIRRVMPGPCVLCGDHRGVRRDGAWYCAACEWRVGDAPDPDLPAPRVDIVYFLGYADRVKIGTTREPRARLRAIRHDELLAFEPGDRRIERARHELFAHLREGREWFTSAPELLAHIRALPGSADPWRSYAQWVSRAHRDRA
ncbi:GIY-YIG nuclease family protein [Microbacterium kunmingense]|uniref:GIY-YIG nuclease family protein n=1 Tax=Microbacterium kunmingense TaxID=2915939 RepID=UPI003D70996D